jgi:hypothetical protein
MKEISHKTIVCSLNSQQVKVLPNKKLRITMNGTSSILRTMTRASTRTLSKQSGNVLFSSECAPALRLKTIFEEYRQVNYSRELPSRFRKEVVKVIEGPDKQVMIDNFNIVLSNIGRSDARLSEAELKDLLMAAGATSRKIHVDQAMLLL